MNYYELLAEDQLKANAFSINNYEKAAELYSKAGEQLKLNRDYNNSLKMYIKAADCYNIINNKVLENKMYTIIYKLSSSINDKILYGHLIASNYENFGNHELAISYLCQTAKLESIQTSYKAIETFQKALQLETNEYYKYNIALYISKLLIDEKQYNKAGDYFTIARQSYSNSNFNNTTMMDTLLMYEIICNIINNSEECIIDLLKMLKCKEHYNFIKNLITIVKNKNQQEFQELMITFNNSVCFQSNIMLFLLVEIQEQF